LLGELSSFVSCVVGGTAAAKAAWQGIPVHPRLAVIGRSLRLPDGVALGAAARDLPGRQC